MFIRRLAGLWLVLLWSAALFARAEAPAGYYDGTDGLYNQALTAKLRQIISTGHTLRSYTTARSTMISTIDVEDDGRIMDVYYNTYFDTGELVSGEHTWPRSRGAESTATGEGDVHHLRPVRSNANSARGNVPFNWVTTTPSTYYGESRLGGGVFEVGPSWRGDIARGIFYFAVRFNLPLFNTGEGLPDTGAMGFQDALYMWHESDPVSDSERRRNDRVYSFQNNRNPFIDRPEFVSRVSTFGTQTVPQMALGLSVRPVTASTDVRVEAAMTSSQAMDATQSFVYYRIGSGGTLIQTPLSLMAGNTTNGMWQTSALPRATAGTVVEYYATARDMTGRTVRTPVSGVYTYTVQPAAGPTATPTPSPTPSLSPTVSPTASPSPTPSASPSVSPTPSPSPTTGPDLDVSGWIVRQENSAQSFTLPAGTVIRGGRTLILARESVQAAFEGYWGVSLPADTTFVNSGGKVPVINGSETYTIENSSGVIQEGPTLALSSSAGQSLRRISFALAANDVAAWQVGGITAGQTTPGAIEAPLLGTGRVYFSEVADTSGTGNFIYEYVEIFYDAPGESPTSTPTATPTPSPTPLSSPSASPSPTPAPSPSPTSGPPGVFSGWIVY